MGRDVKTSTRDARALTKRRHDATYGGQSIPDSGFVIPSSFVIRISSFLFHESKLPKNSPIHYDQGDPATAILRAIERNETCLIVAGALEKEVVLHLFLGNVARRLLREDCSSVILFTHPAREPEPFRKIVFLVEYS